MMRTVNVIAKLDQADTFALRPMEGDLDLVIPLNDHSTVLSTNAWVLLRTTGIASSGLALDFLRLAVTVYTADQIISRDREGFQGWSRHIRLYFPTANAALWDGVKNSVQKMLSFLSGDRWELSFRSAAPASPAPPIPSTPGPAVSKVSLFSGGLDSLIGAIDQLEAGETIDFVSHHKRGSEHPAQEKLFDALVAHYGQGRCRWFDFYVQPSQQNLSSGKENTSRARSLLFLALGIGIANFHGAPVDLIVPENGLISLNVPLTGTRLNSHSTRTTHPHFLSLLQEILVGLGIGNHLVNPYRFKTKGEMMRQCRNQQLLTSIYADSLSCSHADNSHYILGTPPGIHCGYCVPCIIRQAAEHAAGITLTRYVINPVTAPPAANSDSGRDVRAFRMALEEVQGIARHSAVLRVLKPGPLPFSNQAELDGYVDVYLRGMVEVRNFLP